MFATGNLSPVDPHSEVRNRHRLPKAGWSCAEQKGKERTRQLVGLDRRQALCGGTSQSRQWVESEAGSLEGAAWPDGPGLSGPQEHGSK